MVSDEERREVAERLRSANEHSCSPDCELRYALDGSYDCKGNGCTGCRRDAFDRLAGLIYPGDMLYVTYSRSTCGPNGMAYMVKVRHRARGLERDFYAVDLQQLLEVLDEMEITVKCAGPDVKRDYVENWANEVREALGEVVA